MLGAIIQAHLGSSRLPNKVLADICDKSMLQRVIERTQQIKGIDKVIVALPYHQQEIVDIVTNMSGGRWDWLNFHHQTVANGELVPESDVLARYYNCAVHFKLDHVVRITSDCPLLDPEVGTRVVSKFMNGGLYQGGYDYVSNTIPSTFPDGLDVEAFTFEALQQAHQEAASPEDREHVTPYIKRLGSHFRKNNVWNTEDQSKYRLTVDTQEDLDRVKSIYKHFGDKPFTTQDVLNFIGEQ